jgi:hypothetical protein
MSNRLEDLEVYSLSELFGNEIWDIVIGWDYFAKDTVGKQMVIPYRQILQKDLVGFIIKKIRIFVISAVVQ